MGVLIDVLHGAGLGEQILVDAHAVGGLAHGQLVHGARSVGAGAGGHVIRAGGQQVLQVHQVALGAPVGHQALRALEDQVGGVVGLDHAVDGLVAVGVVQVDQLDLHVGIHRVEVGDQALDHGFVGHLAHRVGGKREVGGQVVAGGLVDRLGLAGIGGLGGVGRLGGIRVLAACGAGSKGEHYA